MKFGPVPLSRAEGAILAHSLAVEGGRIRKGRVLDAADIARLAAAGHGRVMVARPEPGDVHEDAAAEAIARALVPDPPAAGLRLAPAHAGRVNIHSEVTGVAEVFASRVHALNAVEPMITLATVAPFARLAPGGMVATVKIISYAVSGDSLRRAALAGRGALRMRPVVFSRATLVSTTLGGPPDEKGHRAVLGRLESLGIACDIRAVAHDEAAIAAALAAAEGELILILTASATSDPHDVAPQAVRRAGGRVTRFGLPVDPGNLLFLGELAGRPVIGLPGCVRSPALNGADWVLERISCGLRPDNDALAAMGVGGLLKDSPARGMPREPRRHRR